MFVLNEQPQSRKRRRQLLEPAGEHSPTPKRQKHVPEANACRRHRPPSFWDTLSKVRLTGGALREFDRRTIQREQRPCVTSESKANLPSNSTLQRLKRFSRHGGPDLTHLRGFACLPSTMSQSSSRSRKRSTGTGRSDSTRTPGRTDSTKKTSPYDDNFRQKLVDEGIYPSNRASKPGNMGEFKQYLAKPRASLSPSKFDDEAFEEIADLCERAPNEPTAMANLMPIIAGRGERSRRTRSDVLFNHLDPIAEGLTAPKPDIYDGARPETIDRRVRAELGRHIVPSTNTSHPAAPNFFVEGKGARGRSDVAQLQACHSGAVGARAMHSLQNYRRDQPVYDGNAYTASNTLHAGPAASLQVHTVHPTAPTVPGGRPQYHMTQAGSYALTHTRERCVEGIAAHRNSQDWSEMNRGSFVEQANQTARRLPSGTPFSSQTRPRASLSTLQADDESATSSDDESDGSAAAKRSRRALGKMPTRRSQNSQRTSRLTAPSARQQPVGTPSSSQTGGHTSLTTPVDDDESDSSDNESDSSSDELARDETTPVKLSSSRAQGKMPARGSQSSQGTSQTAVRPATMVSSQRERVNGRMGWKIEHDDKIKFVPDSLWTPFERNGRKGLYCSSLKVYIFQAQSSGH